MSEFEERRARLAAQVDMIHAKCGSCRQILSSYIPEESGWIDWFCDDCKLEWDDSGTPQEYKDRSKWT